MTQLSITLPDELTQFLQSQIATGNYATPSDYIQTLIQQDQARRAHLETLVLEGINSGPATPMTSDDWATIRTAVNQNLSQDTPND